MKRSRQRPTKSCEECRRKKLKCDRELPCSNCKKGGRDGSTCYFKDAPTSDFPSASKRVRLDDGFEERERRPYGGVSYGDGRDGEIGGREREYYHNVPTLARMGPIGSGREILPYGMNGMSGVDAEIDAIRARDEQQTEAQRRILRGDWERHPNISAAQAESSIAFGRRMLLKRSNEVAGGRRDEMPTPVSSSELLQETGQRALGRVHVKGTRSRYVGIGDRMAIMDHFDESKGFILRSFKDPEMAPLMQELAAYQNAFQPKQKPHIAISQDGDELIAEMMKALPSSFLFGILQARYIQNWETIWRVLHIGTFMKDCDTVSKIIEGGTFTLPPSLNDWVIPQILAVISTASRLNDSNERGSTTERISDDQISKNIRVIKAWLGGLHGKAHVNFPTLQTRTLLLLTLQSNLASPSELYLESGNLVRNAMIMGLHQDPEPWEFSVFDKEARRKLWITIVELDLQFSLAAGLPSSVSTTTFHTRELLNVDDQDMTPEMSHYPPSKQLTTYTDGLPQLALSASLPLRLQITNLLGGNLDLNTSAPQLLHLASALEKSLLSLPSPFRTSTTKDKRLHRLFTSISLELSLRRPLLSLYRSIAMSSISEKYPEARKGALRNALSILQNLDALDPAVADWSVVKGREYLNLFFVLQRQVILESALVLCFEIKQFNTRSATGEEVETEGVDGDEWVKSRGSLTRVVENTLKGMLDRIGEWGSDLKDILPLCVALGGVRCDGDENERRAMMRKGAERCRDACRVARPDVLVKFRTEGGGARACGKDKSGRQRAKEGERSENLYTTGWEANGEIGNAPGAMLNGGAMGYDGFDMTSELGFETMDFGSDWGTNQSWF